jgi:fructose-specific phosphotransferase system component IIB
MSSFTWTVSTADRRNADQPAGKIFDIKWKTTPIDQRVYGKIARWVRRRTDYSRFGKQQMLQLKQFLREINTTYNTNVSLEQAISLRNIVVKDKIISNYARMNQSITTILRLYEHGADITKLSLDFDFPPLNLLRGILLQKGYSATIIFDVFSGRASAKKSLSPRDFIQYNNALQHDAESYINQEKIAQIAAENETAVVEFFRETVGISLQTQEELTAEQMKESGRAVITPDVLFRDTVFINGKRVYWLDFKDYIGTEIKFLYKSNSNQAARYVEKWGEGVLCYAHSYVEGMTIPKTQLLDVGELPIKLQRLKF